jgi:hypothetical protein
MMAHAREGFVAGLENRQHLIVLIVLLREEGITQ